MNAAQYKTLGIFVNNGNYTVRNVDTVGHKIMLMIHTEMHPAMEVTIFEDGNYQYQRGNSLIMVKDPV